MLYRLVISLILASCLLLIAFWGIPYLSASTPPTQLPAVPPTAITSSAWVAQPCVAQPDRFFINAYTYRGDLDHIAIRCDATPTQIYNLDWANPDRIYAFSAPLLPPAGTICTFTIYNQGGLFSQTRGRNLGYNPPPGCDHPGDEAAPGGWQLLRQATWLALPEKISPYGQVAIFNAGFADNAAGLLFNLGEPVGLARVDFSPLIAAARFPVILIPSGGLFGLENSDSFRTRLEEYVRRGGRLIVLAQQRGYEYNILPGGQVNGSGWSEDKTCLRTPVRLAGTPATLPLGSFNDSQFIAHTQGYFTTYPDEATLLLTRAQDQQPVALVYPYGQGQVIATTLYEDWVTANGLVSPESLAFLRNLVGWAIESTEIPAYTPDETAILDVPVTNFSTSTVADVVQFRLVAPDYRITQEQVMSATINPGETITMKFTTTATLPRGIWRVDAMPVQSGGRHSPLAPQMQMTHFIVAASPETATLPPPAVTGPSQPVSSPADLAVTAALDKANYTENETATLTLTVTNQAAHPATSLSAVVRYGEFQDEQSFDLAAHKSQSLTFTLPSTPNADSVIEYGLNDSATACGLRLQTLHLYRSNPDVTLILPHSQPIYHPGDNLAVTIVTITTGTLQIQSPGYSQTLALAGQNTNFSFTLPADLWRGTHSIDYTLDNGPTRHLLFDVAAPWLRITEARLLDLPVVPGDSVRTDLTLASDTALPVAARAWLRYPDATESAAVVQNFSVPAGSDYRITLTVPLSTTQSGPHYLVYQLTDPANPDRIYAAGGELFDVGAAMLLGLQFQYPEGCCDTPPSVDAAILSTRITSAQIQWRLDEKLVLSQTVELSQGIQTLTLPPSDTLAPGWHQIQAQVTAEGLSNTTLLDFVHQSFGPDLVLRQPQLFQPIGFTATLYTYVYNLGDQVSPTATLRFYDGDPAKNGRVIGEATIMPAPAKKPYYNDTQEFSLPWNVAGQAGRHTIYAVVDADNVMPEINEDNNVFSAEVEVPNFSLIPSTDKETYDRGEPVKITIGVANLQANGNLNLTLTTTADLLGYKPFQVTEPITVPANSFREYHYTWDETRTRGGTYNLMADVGAGTGKLTQFTLPFGAEFTGQPLTGTIPLSVTFTDLSSPWGWVDTWQWNFGDGSPMITETNPIHIYTTPGIYTVTLTATAGLSTYTEIKPNYITATYKTK